MWIEAEIRKMKMAIHFQQTAISCGEYRARTDDLLVANQAL